MPRKDRSYRPPTYKTRSLAVTGTENVVSTFDLKEAIEPLILKLNADLNLEGFNQDGEQTGAKQVIGERVQLRDGTPAANVPRRLYDIEHLKTRATRAVLADSFLMALDSSNRESDIPEFPGGKAAATEAVEVYNDQNRLNMTPKQQRKLARSLMHFSQGYIHNETIAEWEIAKGIENLFLALGITHAAEVREGELVAA